MATYYSSSNQRDAVPMLCLRENLPNSYPEAPILPINMTSYMNSGSYSDALSGNSQQQSNCLLIPSIAASHSTTEQQEILANFGGIQTGEQNFSAWTEGQGLSLSLGNHIPSEIQMPTAQDQNPNPNFDSFLGPNPSMSSDGGYKSSSSRDESLRHSEILPPGLVGGNQDLNRGDFSLHGIAGVTRSAPNSRYIRAAQQLLDEVVDIRRAMKQANIKSHSTHGDSRKSSKENEGRQENEKELANGLPSDIQDLASKPSCELSHAEKQDLQNKLAKLLSMLDEVDSRYKQYYHEMQLVVSSFDVVAGRGAAKPYTALALQTISRHFRCLHDAITGQINAMQKNLGEQDHSGNNKGVGISRLRFVDQEIRQQRALQQIGIMQHAWRPQRGLPEGSVSILRAWLFEHFLHPYPKDSDKIMLARQTGLTRSQVSNWFINARVRLWKPMIEDMYKEELGDADMDSNSSSSENASKVTITKGENKNSNARSDDLQHDQSLITNKTCNGGCEGKAEYEIAKQTEEQRPNFDDCGLFPHDSGGDFDRFMGVAGATSQMSEFERIETGRRGVSLTLGLQHCEGGSNFVSSSESHRSFLAMREDQDFYNATAAAASSMRAETAEFECMGAGDQQQTLSSNLVHDFVV